MQQKKSREFLDVTLNLENSSYRPYLKDNKIIYSNTESNHPLSIIKQLPKSIELRLSRLSTKYSYLKIVVSKYYDQDCSIDEIFILDGKLARGNTPVQFLDFPEVFYFLKLIGNS